MITTVDGLRPGQYVKSLAGRDRNHYYLIMGLIGEKFLWVSDGHYHPRSKPKKKNIKHLQITMMVDKKIEEAILRGEAVTDSDIIKAIRRMKNELEEGERFHG
jgi:large subunit ribosomal protein L14e